MVRKYYQSSAKNRETKVIIGTILKLDIHKKKFRSKLCTHLSTFNKLNN